MSGNSESERHIVFAKGRADGLVSMFDSFAAAHDFWKLMHTYKTPHLIATVGRIIDPSTPVVDVSE